MKYDSAYKLPNYKLRSGKVVGGNVISGVEKKIAKRTPVITKYNLHSRITTNTTQKKINNIIKKENQSVSNKRKCTENNDDDDTDIADFTWDEFNVHQFADGINSVEDNDKRDWVSATSVKNYLMKEPLIDWFDLYYSERGYNDNPIVQDQNVFLAERARKKSEVATEMSKLSIFFEMGLKFEAEVMKYLRTKYPNDVKKVVTKYVEQELYNKTLEYMKEGVPIIEQAALYNFNNKTYGISDILIRSDWINKLFENEIIDEATIKIKAPLLNGNYHYRVIDIKWTTMYLCSNGRTLRNSQRFPAYKGQLAIYNSAIGLMQGYTPSEAYILSKSWNLNGGQDEGHNCFTQLGIIDFEEFDKKYIKETHDAIKWVRNVRYNGSKWSCNKPSIPELYPNMCNRYDTPYHGVKRDLSDKLRELTQLWNVGVKHRKIAHTNGIYSWDDPKCSSENMGIHGKKIGPVIDKIIEINRDSTDLIKPNKIQNNNSNWKTTNGLDFYLDFEGITGCLYNRDINLQNAKADNQIVFLVGIGYENNGIWNYKSFLANSIDRNEERRVINEFITFVNNRITNFMETNRITDRDQCRARFFHWSHAEKSILGMLNKRHNNEWHQWKNNVTWIDMCKVFIDEPIVLKGAKKFSLKDIAKTMAAHNMIKTKWQESGPENGMDAMIEAIEYYRYKSTKNNLDINNPIDERHLITIASIIDYNEVDCKVVYEIVDYLRKNHS